MRSKSCSTRIRILLALSIAIPTIVGCSKQENTAPATHVDSTVNVRVDRGENRSQIDEAVLSIVISDLISYHGDDAVVDAPVGRSEEIFIDTSFMSYSPSDETVLKKVTQKYWKAIKDLDLPSKLLGDRKMTCRSMDREPS